jgi:hypothetical protein
MSNVIEYEGGGTLRSASDLRTQVNAVQQAMTAVMKEGTHYGVIPGMKARGNEQPKKTLFKAGSEILLSMFHIAVEPQVEDLSDGNHIRYRVHCVGKHQATGIIVGTGIGEASTAEEKYCWRRASCDEEFEDTDVARRRTKYSEWNGKVTRQKQVRTNPADLANTVLKMAKKRAQIDLCLTSTAASDIFTQDVEDLPEELRGAVDDEPRATMPQAKPGAKKDDAPATSPIASEGQVKHLRRILTADGCPIAEDELVAKFHVESLEKATVAVANAMLQWVKGGDFTIEPTVLGDYVAPETKAEEPAAA